MKRKKMPTVQEIADWYLENTPDWFAELFPSFAGMILMRSDGYLASHCWLTGKQTNLQRCHIVPDALGGSNHPSNFVILHRSAHARCPNVSDPAVFIDWLRAEVKSEHQKVSDAYKLAFGKLTVDQAMAISKVMLECYAAEQTLEDVTGTQSVIPFPAHGSNKYIEQAFVIKRFVQNLPEFATPAAA